MSHRTFEVQFDDIELFADRRGIHIEGDIVGFTVRSKENGRVVYRAYYYDDRAAVLKEVKASGRVVGYYWAKAFLSRVAAETSVL
jgi:hypothetical protein